MQLQTHASIYGENMRTCYAQDGLVLSNYVKVSP